MTKTMINDSNSPLFVQSTMKALVVKPEMSGPCPIELEERPIPKAGQGEVVVRLYAASINYRDTPKKDRTAKVGWPSFITGSDGAGVIAEIGEGVEDWKIGDEVILYDTIIEKECLYTDMGEHSLGNHLKRLGAPAPRGIDGTWAQYIKIPAWNLIHKPKHLDFQQAAALPMGIGTSWRFLRKANLQPGETVLIQGVGGGVALFAMQIAVSMGARVIVTSGSHEKLNRAKQMGAFAGIHYREENVVESILNLTDGIGVDLAIDSGGKETLNKSIGSVRKGGRIIGFGTTTGDAEIKFNDLHSKQITLISSWMASKSEFQAAIQFVNHSKLIPVITVYNMENIEEAYLQIQDSIKFGKVVINLK